MGLGDITREAVLAAVGEFDALGGDAFLEKYGFDEARSYFLVQDDKRYDSKAIVGAAHGYLPGRHPLAASEFSGGDKTVRARLEELGFVVESSPRNPPWVRDELILALDLYFRHRPDHISKTHPEVVALSEILNGLPLQPARPDARRFRNPNGVYMKLCNFLRFDPEYQGKGLEAGGKAEELVWKDFAGDRERLRQVAAAILAGSVCPRGRDGDRTGRE
jgi:5-methylcytosine-specific restriction protein A